MRDDYALQNNPHISRQALQDVHPQLFGWAMTRCGFDRAAAEDLMQQAYVELLSGRARFNNKSTLKTFVFGVVQNLAMSRMRQLASRMRIVRRHAAELVPAETDNHDADDTDSVRIWQAVAQLPARQRDITELVFCRDMSIEDASAVMGVTVGTGRVHYDRAKKALAANLTDLRRL